MTNDELVIREAIREEANQAVDPGTVLSSLHSGRKPRRGRGFAVAVAGVAVAAGIAGVMIPLMSSRGEPTGPASANASAETEQTILLLGLDNREGSHTDSIVLLRVGADGSFRALSLPRDTQTSDGKLNTPYAGANGGDAGAKATITEVETLTGVRAQHYATLDMADFPELSTAVGGVEVCLKNAVKDRYSGADFPAGKQAISGTPALAFLRQRHGLPNGDLDRIARHQAFLRGLTAKLGKADSAQLSALANTLKRAARTDPELDVLGLAGRLTAKSGITAATIPTEGSVDTPNAGQALKVDKAKVRQFTSEFFGGTASPGAPGGSGGGADIPCVN